jgi:HlyD family secretion protein
VSAISQFIARRRRALVGAAVVLGAAVAVGAYSMRNSVPSVPTAEVRLDEFVNRLELRGEVRALESIVLNSPSGAGDLQILKLVRTGAIVKEGDVVAQFDATTLTRTLEQKQSELKAAEAEVERVRAQDRMALEQAETEFTKARYDVERARLETGKQEILSEIEGEHAALRLNDAEQKLREMEKTVETTKAANAAELAIALQKREKVLYEVRQSERQIASLTLRAPSSGMATLLPNFRARGGGFWGGGSAPEFKEGDRAWPGAGIVELPNLSGVRVAGRVDEAERGRLHVGQKATVRVDAIADREFVGEVDEISPVAKPDFSGWPPTKTFDVSVRLSESDPRLRPGMSSMARVAIETLPDSVLVPSEAVIPKNGRQVVYVLRGSRFEERVVSVAMRGSGQVVIASGLKPGEKVALQDPTADQAATK